MKIKSLVDLKYHFGEPLIIKQGQVLDVIEDKRLHGYYIVAAGNKTWRVKKSDVIAVNELAEMSEFTDWFSVNDILFFMEICEFLLENSSVNRAVLEKFEVTSDELYALRKQLYEFLSTE